MPRIFFAALFFIISLSSCGNKIETGIPLFNNVAFKLQGQEKAIPLEAAAEKKYRTYFNNQPLNQIPLLKHIKHPDYELFIGLPYNTSFERLKQNRASTETQHISCTPNSCFKQYKTDDLQITEYLYQTPGKSLIFIAALTALPNLPDSLFSAAAFGQRILITE